MAENKERPKGLRELLAQEKEIVEKIKKSGFLDNLDEWDRAVAILKKSRKS